ncbi:MAG TPA: PAS domain-containing sensor histidine kinase [Thermodesulfobacteriota bacterium]|nr:PAS domain-containing sensor histidine kinase [Thermodesulfobacteriota bacterium]
MGSRGDAGADLASLGRVFVEHSPRAVVILEGPGRVIRYVNPAFCALFGRLAGTLLDRPLADAFPAGTVAGLLRVVDRVEAAAAGAREVDVREAGAAPAGDRYYTYTAWPLFGPAGELHAVAVEVTDTTERVQMRQQTADALEHLREINERLLLAGVREWQLAQEAEAARERAAFLAEVSTELATSLDYEPTLESVARLTVARLADWCILDLATGGRSFDKLVVAHADPAQGALAQELRRFPPDPDRPHPASEALRTGRPELVPEVTDGWLVARARSEAHLMVLRALAPRSFMVVPLLARGTLLGALTLWSTRPGRRYGPADLALAEELARRAALAVDNARLYREAQEAVRARDAFLARASHELRTPLTSAIGTVRLLQRALEGRLSEPPGELLAIASRNLDAMLVLINNLLDASKLAAGQESLALSPVELGDAVARSVEVVAAQARDKGVALRVGVPAGLRLMADPLKLEQVLVNLLANAVTFTPAGGEVRVDADVEGAGGAAAVLIRVRDTGDGIAAEHLERIFEPFFQARGGAVGRKRGTGLGLAICRQLVALHGGDIWAESDGPGRGSTFTVRLPAAGAGRSVASPAGSRAA